MDYSTFPADDTAGQGEQDHDTKTGGRSLSSEKGRENPLKLRRRWRMRRISMMVLALSLAAAGTVWAGAAGPTNFSGTWLLDKSKSDLAALSGMGEDAEKAQHATVTMVVEHQGTTLQVTRTLKTDTEEKTQTQTYRTDGTETTNTGPRGGAIVSTASWEGDRLVIVSTRTMALLWKDVSVQGRTVWSLSPDGNTLLIESHIRSPRGDQHFKGVFDKQRPS
jgi:hypothetical protein